MGTKYSLVGTPGIEIDRNSSGGSRNVLIRFHLVFSGAINNSNGPTFRIQTAPREAAPRETSLDKVARRIGVANDPSGRCTDGERQRRERG
jgi:hypothetical protein